MAEMKLEISVKDMPEIMELLARYRKIQKRRAWIRRKKARKQGWRK